MALFCFVKFCGFVSFHNFTKIINELLYFVSVNKNVILYAGIHKQKNED